MIGTVDNARLALSGTLPELGEGCERVAYLIDGYVYKVDKFPYLMPTSNEDEWDTYNRLVERDLVGVRIPLTNLISVDDNHVIVMEYVEGKPVGECYCIPGESHDPGCLPEDVVMSIVDQTGVSDLCYGNLILRDGDLYLVDMEC